MIMAKKIADEDHRLLQDLQLRQQPVDLFNKCLIIMTKL